MFSKIIQEIVRGKMFFCSFVLLYVPIVWWAVLSGKPIAIQTTWIMTFFLGIIIVIVGIVTSIEALQSSSWSKAKAKLTECKVKRISDTGGSTYAPSVSYQFRVGDRQYIGSSYDFSDISGSRIGANRKIEFLKERLDREDCIDIYYGPDQPELNVIFPGVHPIHGVRLVFGLVLITLSLPTLLEVIQW